MNGDPSELPTEVHQERRHGIRFDGTINLGHVMTFAAGMFAGFAVYNSVDKRILVLEEARTFQVQRDTQQDALARERADVVSQGLDKIDLRLDKISDQLARPSK